MPDINYVNPKIKNITKKDLSIQVSLSGFSFLIVASETKECLSFRNYKFENIQLVDELLRNIEQILFNEHELKLEFAKKELFYINQKATLIPEEFFKAEDLKKYFEFNHTLNEYDELHYKELLSINAYSVFSLPNLLTNTFYTAFPGINFYHQTSKLISLGESKTTNDYTIIVGLQAGFFDIVIFEKKKLLLYNSFQYTNALDFIYFLIYPLNQLKIDPSTQEVIIVGEVNNNSAVISEIKSKVQKVSYPELDNNSTCKQLNNKQKLEFFNLFL